MKEQYFMMSPTASGRDIDVYLRPLIDELKDGMMVSKLIMPIVGDDFVYMRLLFGWLMTFFAYGNLFGWSTKGYMACPICKKKIKHHKH